MALTDRVRRRVRRWVGRTAPTPAPTGPGPIPLARAAAADRAEIGGKALPLAQLVAAGLPVPDGYVVPAQAFRDALWREGLLPLAERVARTADADAARQLRDAIAALPVPEPLLAPAAALAGPFAVRSSGVDEDGAARSFAGQHTTRLGVPADELADAIRACWASLYAENALAYRTAGPAPGSLAVLVQRLVEPEVAGVMFTVNPTSGSWREMVVEAVWGLGEGLVSGQIAPHWYLVRRPRDLPRAVARVAERVRLQLVRRDLPALPERWVPTADGRGVEVVENPPSMRTRPTLDAGAVRRLCRLGLRIERLLGGPQDVEWARERSGAFVVLQARPITAAGPTRGERVLDAAVPGRALARPGDAPRLVAGGADRQWLIAYPDTQDDLLGGGPALRLVHGRPYVNATVFRHLAFKLPGAPPPSFMLELVPPEEERVWRSRFAVAPDWAVYRSIFRTTFAERRWERFRWNRSPTPGLGRLRAACRPLPGLEAPVAAAGRRRAWRSTCSGSARYAGIHICSLLFANIWYQLLDGALAGWLRSATTR
ncbi:MAG: PEP/pyruvate-binding domain-containing protein [Myxococcota bacterium]